MNISFKCEQTYRLKVDTDIVNLILKGRSILEFKEYHSKVNESQQDFSRFEDYMQTLIVDT